MKSNDDANKFKKFTLKSDNDKLLHTLEGMIFGIGIDSKLNEKEIEEIEHWIKKSKELKEKEVYQELVQTLRLALADGILSEEEKKDILWICKRFKTENIFYDVVTADIQRLHGILHGIMADGIIEDGEIKALKLWLSESEDLKGAYPYDELYSLVLMVLRDRKIDKQEYEILKVFFSEFIDFKKSLNLDQKEIHKLKAAMTVSGICAMDPDISIKGKKFCFTGKSEKAKRDDIQKLIEKEGGTFFRHVRVDLDFLIIGAGGNSSWTYSCYGRKVEEAIEYRKQGKKIQIINELDFWDFLNE